MEQHSSKVMTKDLERIPINSMFTLKCNSALARAIAKKALVKVTVPEGRVENEKNLSRL